MFLSRRNILSLLSALAFLTTTTGQAQQQVTPSAPILLTSPIVTINSLPDNQPQAPNVDGDVAVYKDENNSIHYYRFSTGVDIVVPGPTSPDYFPSVSGNRICFAGQTPTNDFYDYEVRVLDVTTSSVTLIDPNSGDLRLYCALGGNTLAYADFGNPRPGESFGTGDIFTYDLAANPPSPPQAVSLSPNTEFVPRVSPDGNTIVWESCPSNDCNILQAVHAGGSWAVSTVADSSEYEEFPDTDGTWVVYDAANFSGGSSQFSYVIRWKPVAAGTEMQLIMPGWQVSARVSRGFISFISLDPGTSTNDVYVYDIAHNDLYRVTSTSGIHKSGPDISVLDNGDVRLVWSSWDGSETYIYGTTFTPISHQVSYQICPLYDANVARKSGSAYPIKVQLCDSAGNNLSSSSITLHAVRVTQTSTNVPAELDDTGNANFDGDFRYDPTLAGYIFNLSTKGYATGTYSLNFTAGADPAIHSAPFAVR